VVVHHREPGIERAISDAIADYRARFRQEAVLRVDAEVCAEF
jgi:hypothetical protein